MNKQYVICHMGPTIDGRIISACLFETACPERAANGLVWGFASIEGSRSTQEPSLLREEAKQMVGSVLALSSVEDLLRMLSKPLLLLR